MTNAVLTYVRPTSVQDVIETHLTEQELYHQLFLFLNTIDSFNHQDMKVIASAMDVVKKSMND